MSPNDDPTMPKSDPSHTVDYVEDLGDEKAEGDEPYDNRDTEEIAQQDAGMYVKDLNEQDQPPVDVASQVHGGEIAAEHDVPEDLRTDDEG